MMRGGFCGSWSMMIGGLFQSSGAKGHGTKSHVDDGILVRSSPLVQDAGLFSSPEE